MIQNDNLKEKISIEDLNNLFENQPIKLTYEQACAFLRCRNLFNKVNTLGFQIDSQGYYWMKIVNPK